MSKIELGPTGNSIIGDVLDVSKKTLEAHIQHYDPQLYLKWNPTKNHGYGVWELRRRPEKKTIVERVMYKGNTYCVVDYQENNWEHHVKDLPQLNYSLLQWLKDADQWTMSNYDPDRILRLQRHLKHMDEAEQRKKDEQAAKARDDMMYKLKQDKAILNDFREKVVSGVNPAHLMRFWK
jgi:guanylate kinase